MSQPDVQCQFFSPGHQTDVSTAVALLGRVVWLWLRSPLHREWPVIVLRNHVMPSLQHGSFAMMHDGRNPLGFFSWASLSEEAERRYLKNPNSLRPEDWVSGDRVWIIDMVAPFGHLPEAFRYIVEMFRRSHVVVRFLRVRPGEEQSKIKEMYSPDASAQDKDQNQLEFYKNYALAFDL